MAYVANNPQNLLGEYTVSADLTTLLPQNLLNNPSGSGRTYKIIAIIAANIDGTNACIVTVSRYSAASLGGTEFPIANEISVPADASLIVADATTPIMLPPNTSLGATAGAINAITMTVTYQEYAS